MTSDFDKHLIETYKALHEKACPHFANNSFFCTWRRTATDGQRVSFDKEAKMFVFLPQEGLIQLPPLADYKGVDWDSFFAKYFQGQKAINFFNVPSELLHVWQGKFGSALTVAENRDFAEYLYEATSFASLSGRKYEKKRNHLNFFRKHFTYEYMPMTSELVPSVKQFQRDWLANQLDKESIKGHFLPKEDVLIDYMLGNWGDFCPRFLEGGVIFVNGALSAYTIGEVVADSIIIHIEKANSKIHGLYQAISHEFLNHMAEAHPEIKTVNREEDMGDPGLRHAKMSYHPDGFSKNYSVKIEL